MKNFILLTFILLSTNLYGYTFQDAKQACERNESKKVLKIYDELLKDDNLKAKKELFRIYSWGKCGIQKDEEKGRMIRLEVANMGDRSAAMAVGGQYLLKDFKDLKKAYYWFTKYGDITDAKIQNEIATKYSILGYHDESLIWYLKSAKQSYKPSFYWLGKIYAYGLGNTLENPKKAIYWWEKGAELGDHSSMEKVADLYMQFDNEIKYVHWSEKAALRDASYKTQYWLGRYYFHDYNKYTDKKRAAYWIKKAHKNGSKDAKEFWDDNELWKYE